MCPNPDGIFNWPQRKVECAWQGNNIGTAINQGFSALDDADTDITLLCSQSILTQPFSSLWGKATSEASMGYSLIRTIEIGMTLPGCNKKKEPYNRHPLETCDWVDDKCPAPVPAPTIASALMPSATMGAISPSVAGGASPAIVGGGTASFFPALSGFGSDSLAAGIANSADGKSQTSSAMASSMSMSNLAKSMTADGTRVIVATGLNNVTLSPDATKSLAQSIIGE